MEKIIYPAIFHKEKDGRYRVEFPDLPGCLTDGDTVEEAFFMAGDALDCWFADPVQNSSESKRRSRKGWKSGSSAKTKPATIPAVDRSYITHIVNGTETPLPDMAKRMGLLLGFDWRIFYADSGVCDIINIGTRLRKTKPLNT